MLDYFISIRRPIQFTPHGIPANVIPRFEHKLMAPKTDYAHKMHGFGRNRCLSP